jgi:16S rRNA processing protein RimM
LSTSGDGHPGATDSGRLLDVGYVARPHGLRGEVVVRLTTDRTERLAPGAVLHRGTRSGAAGGRAGGGADGGELVVRASRPHQDRWIVDFAGVSGREAAEALQGTVLLAEPLDDPEEMWVHDLVGADVVTVAGESVGRCVSVVANPASDLIELDGGALVPVVFVVDRQAGRITIDPPEGLFDL